MNEKSPCRSERGQALAESAVTAMAAILLAFGTLSLIVLHRARTVSISASYACAQFLSQAPDPRQAAQQAYDIADRTVNSDWSGLLNVKFRIDVNAPAGSGAPGKCAVYYNAHFLFNGLFGIPDEWAVESFYSRSEAWKAEWR